MAAVVDIVIHYGRKTIGHVSNALNAVGDDQGLIILYVALLVCVGLYGTALHQSFRFLLDNAIEAIDAFINGILRGHCNATQPFTARESCSADMG